MVLNERSIRNLEGVRPELVAYAAFRRQMRRRETQFGNGFWWEPGKTAPSRAPRLN